MLAILREYYANNLILCNALTCDTDELGIVRKLLGLKA